MSPEEDFFFSFSTFSLQNLDVRCRWSHKCGDSGNGSNVGLSLYSAPQSPSSWAALQESGKRECTVHNRYAVGRSVVPHSHPPDTQPQGVVQPWEPKLSLCPQNQPKVLGPSPRHCWEPPQRLEAGILLISEFSCQILRLFLLNLLDYGYFRAAADRN